MRSLAWVLFATASATAQSIQPYTVIEVTRLFDSSGNVRSEQRFLFAVNREGSIVSMDLDPAAGGTRQIVDVSRGDVLVNPATRSASVMPRSVQLRQVGQPCDQRFRSSWDVTVLTDNAAGTIFGVPVERVSVERPDGRGMDVFMAPSLGC